MPAPEPISSATATAPAGEPPAFRGLSVRSAMWLVAALTGWLAATAPVFSQEAYYWCYAQQPDLGYFDHPPLMAWLIWLGTQLFGDGAIGIRFGTWAASLGTTWLGVLLLREFGVRTAGQVAWVLAAVVSPILAMTHFLANPDPPLVFGWTLAFWSMWRARQGHGAFWLLAGVAAGLGLLGKYSAVFLAPAGVAVLLFDGTLRKQLLRPWPYLAVVVAALVFSPVVIWNAQHDWASFKFQTANRFAKAELSSRWVTELLSTQVLVLHPFLAVLAAIATVWLLRRVLRDVRALWLLAFALPLPAYMGFQSLWIQVKINWLAPAYVPLLLGTIVWWQEARGGAPIGPRWLRATLWLVPIVLLFAPALRLAPTTGGTSWAGWDEVARASEKWLHDLDGRDGKPGNVFVFSADYRDCAQLLRARTLLRDDATFRPHDAPTLAPHVWGAPGLQFEYWTSAPSRIGQDAVYVLPRPGGRDKKVEHVQRVFTRIEKVDHIDVQRLGITVMDADIWLCFGYRGPAGS